MAVGYLNAPGHYLNRFYVNYPALAPTPFLPLFREVEIVGLAEFVLETLPARIRGLAGHQSYGEALDPALRLGYVTASYPRSLVLSRGATSEPVGADVQRELTGEPFYSRSAWMRWQRDFGFWGV